LVGLTGQYEHAGSPSSAFRSTIGPLQPISVTGSKGGEPSLDW
jgi:hypothetical protein